MSERLFVCCIGIFLALVTAGGCDRAEPEPAKSADPDSIATPDEPPTQSATIPPENIEASLKAADQYFSTGELDKARAILEVLVERAPREGPARELYGQVLALLALQAGPEIGASQIQELLENAYEQYRVACDITPDSPGLHHSAGMIANEAGRREDALEHFLIAGRLDPLNPQPPTFAAQLLIQLDRLDEAHQQLTAALKIDKDEPVIYASLAIIAMKGKQFAEALSLIREARSIDPRHLGLLAQESRIHRESGEPRRGLEGLIALNEYQRSHVAIAAEIASGYEAIGEPTRAAEAWEHRYNLLVDQPDRWRDALRAGQIYLRAGKRELAWKWLQVAKLIAPDDPDIRAFEAAFKTTDYQPSSSE
ncbi:MAG: tetratricopeptide repeat protein [Planctomycetes bacterium]|nr:tetratricopeptide repeat protein [Planctomycetota bacterium]